MVKRQDRQNSEEARTDTQHSKRKRGSPEPVTNTALPEEQEHTSDTDTSEQSEQALLDSFQQDTAEPVGAFTEAAAHATAFLQPSEQLSALARQAAKALYEYTASSATTGTGQQAPAMLTQLHVEGFDAEQIWLQLDMASAHLVRRARRLLKKAGCEPELLTPEMDQDLEDLLKGGTPLLEGSDADQLDLLDAEAASDEEEEEDEEGGGDDEGMLSEEDEDENAPGATQRPAAKRSKTQAKAALLPTEDRYFKLDDLESFLQDSERAAAMEEEEDGEDHLGADDDGDEDDEADEDLLLGGEDVENDSDADLDALLEDANRLIGRPASSRKRAKTGNGRHVNRPNLDQQGSDYDADMEQDIMHDDFWGSSERQQGRAGRRSEQDAELEDEEADSDEVQPEDDDDGDNELHAASDMDEDDLNQDASDGQDDLDDDGMGIFRKALDQSVQPLQASVAQDMQDEEATGRGRAENLSKHERQQQRMQERIARLEAQNMADKDWFMQGEAGAARRPLNSALELDLDFERQVRPPPQPTEDATASLEDLIKQRIADQQFDDPPKILPPQPEKQKVELDLNDKKSQKGLGEVYEEEYVAAATGATAAVDKQDAVRQEARTLMKELFAKLDALSHFHFAPKPIIEEMSVRADVPALAMEEVAPQVASEEAMRAPEEVYKAQQQGAPRASEELTREQRSQARAKRKRAGRKQKAQQIEAKRTLKPEGNVIGLKSEKALVAKESKKGMKTKDSAASISTDAKFDYSKSGAVFKKLQEQRDAKAAGIFPGRGDADVDTHRKKAGAFKL